MIQQLRAGAITDIALRLIRKQADDDRKRPAADDEKEAPRNTGVTMSSTRTDSPTVDAIVKAIRDLRERGQLEGSRLIFKSIKAMYG